MYTEEEGELRLEAEAARDYAKRCRDRAKRFRAAGDYRMADHFEAEAKKADADDELKSFEAGVNR